MLEEEKRKPGRPPKVSKSEMGLLRLKVQVKMKLELEKARRDPNAFMEYCFGFRQHQYMKKIQEFQFKERSVILMSPESGKSAQVTIGRTIWEAGHNPNLRQAIICASKKLASSFLSEIKQNILTNEKIKQVFPDLAPETRPDYGDKWNEDQINLKRTLLGKDPSIQVTGVGGTIVAARVDRMILDDVLTFKNTLAPGQCEKIIRWFYSSECLGRMTAGSSEFKARLTLVGVPWTVDDLIAVATKEEAQGGLEYPCLRLPMDTKHDPEAAALYGPILWPMETMVSGRIVGFDQERLKSKRKEMPEIEYQRQMCLMTLSESGAYFNHKTLLANMVREDTDPFAKYTMTYNGPDPVIVGIDPGVKKRKRANSTAFFVAKVNPLTRQRVVLWAKKGQYNPRETVKILVSLFYRYPSALFKVEDNAAQSTVIEFLKDPAVLQAMSSEHLLSLAEATELSRRIQPTTTDIRKHDFRIGIGSMAIEFESGFWTVPREEEMQEWFLGLLGYSPVEHTDDMVMASWFVHEAMRDIVTKTMGGGSSLLQIGSRLKPLSAGMMDAVN